MARKKVVFVIVEGPSDDAALGVIMSRVFDKNTVYVEIIHGDITSNRAISPNNIASALGDIVKRYALSMHFNQSDFLRVIHIVDMDGAFVLDDSIIHDPSAKKTVYHLTEIRTDRPDDISLRNRDKQLKIERISRLDKIWRTIPYQVYYMSCNLDHVLYDVQNSTDEEKENNAYLFSKRYKDDIDGFLTIISDSTFSRMEGYRESWDFIKNDLHSLERWTNLGLCFKEIREESEQAVD